MIWLFYLIPLAGFIVLGYFTFREFKKYKRISKTGFKTEGTVTRVDTEMAGNSNEISSYNTDIYIGFSTREGKEYNTMLESFFRFSFRNKEKITIYYNPDNPKEITPSGTWLTIRFIILWIVSIPFILVVTALLMAVFTAFR